MIFIRFSRLFFHKIQCLKWSFIKENWLIVISLTDEHLFVQSLGYQCVKKSLCWLPTEDWARVWQRWCREGAYTGTRICKDSLSQLKCMHISKTQNCCAWWNSLGQPAMPHGHAIVDTRYRGSNCCTVFWATALGEAFQLLVEPEGGDGFPSSSDTAAGRVGFAHWRVVCGSPPEHILQLLPPLPLDISPGFPLSSVHGKFIFLSP